MGMMKCEVPPEVTSFKEKFFFGLTVRQLGCVAGMLALAVPTGIFGSKVLPSDLVQWLVLLETVPLAAVGFFRYNDMPVEVIGKKVLRYYFGNQKRKYMYTPLLYSTQAEIRELDYQDIIADKKLNKKLAKKNKKKTRKTRE